jgi:hypothetical protein
LLSPATIGRRLLFDAPPLVLNLMLAGTRGAVAAGLFEIARKISTVPLIVRQAFAYVMAPLSVRPGPGRPGLIARSTASLPGSRPRWWCRSPDC